ncbi:MAG: hypothetical protein M1830_000189 [Pleopsidium flavum]|nr:MAG: hypothetical protein M1830_000189 [Pleopsidium flavum]
MAEAFSVATSSFAAIGLADVVIRVGKELYSFLAAIKVAPIEIRRLQSDLQDLKVVVSEVKYYWEEFNLSSSLGNSHSVPPSFISSLEGLREELLALAELATKQGIVKRWAGKIKWVFEEREIAKSLTRLESHKAALNTALILVGRRNDLTLYKEVKSVHSVIEDTMLQTAANENVLQDCIQRGTDELASAITKQSQEHQQRLQGVQDAVLAGQTNFELATSGVRQTAVVVQKGFLAAESNASKRHKEIRRKITRTGTNTTRGLSALRSDIKTLTATFVNVSMLETKTWGGISFNGQSREILLPLLLLQPRLCEAISQLLLRNQHEICKEHLLWLKSEFQGLLVSSMQDIADTSRKPMSSVVDSSQCLRCSPNPFTKVHFCEPTSSSLGDSGVVLDTVRKQKRDRGPEAGLRRRGRRLIHKSWYFELPIGKLYVNVIVGSSDSTSPRSGTQSVGFSFVPRPDICSTALNAWFTKSIAKRKAPQLSTQLNAYTAIDSSNDFDDICRHGTIKDIDTAFREGKASPFTLDACGMSIHNSAAYYGRLDLLKYLVDQGLGPCSIDGGSQALSGLWESLQGRAYHADNNVESSQTMFNFLLDHGCDIDAVSGGFGLLLHSTVHDSSAPYTVEKVQQLGQWTKLLKHEGYDFDKRDPSGLTALLSHALSTRALSTQNVRLLLDEGADPQAQDQHGSNALQKAMHSLDNGELFLDNVDRKLRLLIGARCDVNHCDVWGQTPSDDALSYDCWDEWCSALEANGLDVHDVLRADREHKERFIEQNRGDLSGNIEGVYEYGSESSDALNDYLEWKKESVDCYAKIKKLVSQNHALSGGKYPAVVDFLETSTIELLPGRGSYEDVHREIADLVNSGCDLISYLEAFFRVVPGNKRFTKTVFRLRKWDIHDDVVSTLNRMKVRAPLKAMRGARFTYADRSCNTRERIIRVLRARPDPRPD